MSETTTNDSTQLDVDMSKKETRSNLFNIPPHMVDIEDGFNVRHDYGDMEELCKQILEHGIRNPLRGYRKGGRIILTDGHRRFKAVQMLMENGHTIETIPFVTDKHPSAESRLIDLIICNEGEPLKPLEEAEVIKRLSDLNFEKPEIATRIGKTVVYVTNLLRLSQCSEKIKKHIRSNVITSTLVIDLMKRNMTDEEMEELIDKAIDNTIGHEFGVRKTVKNKITKKDLNRVANNVNSWASIKKIFKEESLSETKRPIKENTKKLYEFLQNIIEGKYNEEQLTKLFFEDDNSSNQD